MLIEVRLDSNLDPSGWMLGKSNEQIPSVSLTPESMTSRIVYYIVLFVLWYLIINRYADTKHRVEILSGFIFGMVLLILLDYINTTQVGKIPHLNKPTIIKTSGYMEIDATTRKSLAITNSLKGGKKSTLFETVD